MWWGGFFHHKQAQLIQTALRMASFRKVLVIWFVDGPIWFLLSFQTLSKQPESSGNAQRTQTGSMAIFTKVLASVINPITCICWNFISISLVWIYTGLVMCGWTHLASSFIPNTPQTTSPRWKYVNLQTLLGLFHGSNQLYLLKLISTYRTCNV